MNRKIFPLNHENSVSMASFGVDKISEIRLMINKIINEINENKSNMDSQKPIIFQKLEEIINLKEKLMVYLQKYELDIELRRIDADIKQTRKKPQSHEIEKNNIFEFEKKAFSHKLSIILKKLDYEILIVKFKKISNNMKAFCLIWENFFTVYIYLEKSKFKSLQEKNGSYRIFDIVCTRLNDNSPSSHYKTTENRPLFTYFNDFKEIKDIRESDSVFLAKARIIDTKIQFLKKTFETHFSDLVFTPDTMFFEKITHFVKKVFLSQKIHTYIEFEFLVCWYFEGLKQLLSNENIKCHLCGNKMIFDSPKYGFLPCTAYKNNKFYHDKCFIFK